MAAHALKGYKGIGMEGWIARWYAVNTGKDMEQYKVLADRVAATVAPGSRVLEVAPGPGYLSLELARRSGLRVTGLDVSATCVEIAKKNAAEQNVHVDFQQGNAAAMPFADASFDFLICRAAFKNFSEPVKAMQEMRRVLAAGSRALIIDLRRDVSMAMINQAVDKMGLSAVNRVITKLTFRGLLLRRAYSKQDFEAFAAQGGFDNCEIEQEGIGLEVNLQK